MRILKVILLGVMAACALLASLLTAMLVAAVTVLRLLRHRRRTRSAQPKPGTEPIAPSPGNSATGVRGTVIDVVAREVTVPSEDAGK